MSQGHMSTKRKDKVICFAYGSNMFSPRMCHPDRVPSARPVGIGYVTGHQLRFDKAGKDGSGKCDAEETQNASDRVYGALYSIDKSEQHKLDDAEGLRRGYDETPVKVVTATRVVPAVMYYATSKDPSLKPYHWYKALVVAGAVEHGLPFPYVELLRTVDSVQDPVATRRAEHERLLTAGELARHSARSRRRRPRGLGA